VPALPTQDVDLIYLCFPNNPAGATATREQLQAWVDWARAHKALILFDAAYEAFIRDERLPHSIYEIAGVKEVAIEFRSFSKTAGFTGVRCAYTVVPEACTAWDDAGKPVSVRDLWSRRHTTKFNGVSYPVQRAAEAVYSAEGRPQVRELIDFYLNNAAYIRKSLQGMAWRARAATTRPTSGSIPGATRGSSSICCCAMRAWSVRRAWASGVVARSTSASARSTVSRMCAPPCSAWPTR